MYVYVDTKAVSEHCKAECMTREDLANSAGLSMCTVKHLFNCRYRRLREDTSKKIHNAIGADPGEFNVQREVVVAYLIDAEMHLNNGHAFKNEKQRAKTLREAETLKRLLGRC